MDIISDIQLRAVMQEIVENVLKDVSSQLLKLLKQYIKDKVYFSHDRNKIYPSFSEEDSEFYNAFSFTEVKNLTSELFYDWQSMHSIPESPYRHSSISPKWPRDTRSVLMEYLNKFGKDSSLFASVEREAFWDSFVNDILTSGKIWQLFDQSFSQYGVIR